MVLSDTVTCLWGAKTEVWAKAVTCCQLAGTRAFERAAFREAVAAFEQALQALAYLPEDGATGEIGRAHV